MLSGPVRYQVFISSTYKDLVEERQRVTEVLLELGCIPSGMEIFPAATVEPWTLIRRMIDDCDYFILIVKGLLGTIHEGTGLSYTRMEYDYALSIDKPVIAFLHADPQKLPRSESEIEPDRVAALNEFREKVKTRLIRTWSSPNQLASRVSTSLFQTMTHQPAQGWVRPGSARTAATPTPSKRPLIDSLRVMLEGSRFARRLTKAADAKQELARFAVDHGIWRQDDHVFLDSGTMPVYLISHLLRTPERDAIRPRRILTNNIAVAVLELIAGGQDLDETQVSSLPESPLEIELMAGVVLESYAATMPHEPLDSDLDDSHLDHRAQELAARQINHIILMTTRITAEEGPCAVSLANRRHKRMLLRYARDRGARITVMAEVDKIVARRDDCADSAAWRELAANGQVTLVCGTTDPDRSISEGAERQLEAMRSMGVLVQIADTDPAAS